MVQYGDGEETSMSSHLYQQMLMDMTWFIRYTGMMVTSRTGLDPIAQVKQLLSVTLGKKRALIGLRPGQKTQLDLKVIKQASKLTYCQVQTRK
jgi:hypothetical protein